MEVQNKNESSISKPVVRPWRFRFLQKLGQALLPKVGDQAVSIFSSESDYWHNSLNSPEERLAQIRARYGYHYMVRGLY